jgi:hypothetical protein
MTILKKGRAFRLVMRRTTTGEKQFYIQCTAANAHPTARRVRERDLTYLQPLHSDLDAACVINFGVGVFQ